MHYKLIDIFNLKNSSLRFSALPTIAFDHDSDFENSRAPRKSSGSVTKRMKVKQQKLQPRRQSVPIDCGFLSQALVHEKCPSKKRSPLGTSKAFIRSLGLVKFAPQRTKTREFTLDKTSEFPSTKVCFETTRWVFDQKVYFPDPGCFPCMNS